MKRGKMDLDIFRLLILIREIAVTEFHRSSSSDVVCLTNIKID